MTTSEQVQEELERIIKISAEDQKFLLRYLSRLPPEIRIDIEGKKKNLFFYLKSTNTLTNKNTLSYAAHILAIKYVYSREKRFTTKDFDSLSIKEIRDLSMIKLLKQKDQDYIKKNSKRQKLLHYWAAIKMYRQHGSKTMSFEKISQRLKKDYNFEVSHNTIAVLWRSLEQNKNKDK